MQIDDGDRVGVVPQLRIQRPPLGPIRVDQRITGEEFVATISVDVLGERVVPRPTIGVPDCLQLRSRPQIGITVLEDQVIGTPASAQISKRK